MTDRYRIDAKWMLDRWRIDAKSMPILIFGGSPPSFNPHHGKGYSPGIKTGVRSGINPSSFREHQEPSGTLPGPSGMPKILKKHQKSKKKNHQFQFLRLRFEALDELDRLVTLPRLENIGK